MGTLRHWVRASRPLAQANIAVPLLFGQALAFREHGVFSLGWLIYLAVFGLLDQLFIVFGNDYADRETDGPFRTPFSGGSGVIREGAIEPSALRRAAIVAAAALLVLAAAALPWRPLLLPMAIAAIALLWAYSFPPVLASYRGGGEWLQAAGVGVLLPFTGYYAQSGRWDPPVLALVASLLAGLAGNLLTAVPDVEGDTRSNKRSPAVVHGEFATILACASLLAAAAWVMFASGTIPRGASVPIAIGVSTAAAFALGAGFYIPSRRAARLSFVVVGGAAQHLLFLAWSVSLVLWEA